MKKKIYAALATAICAGALVALPASSVAATPHGSGYGTCTGAYSTYSTCKHVKPILYNTYGYGWWKYNYKFGFSLHRGSANAFDLKSFEVTLPKGITWDKHTWAKHVSVSQKATVKLVSKSVLLVTLKSNESKVSFAAGGAATNVNNAAAKSKFATVNIAVTDSYHKTYKLSYSEKAPKPVKKHHH